MGGRAAVLPAVVACLLAAEADLGAGEGLLAGTSPAEVEKALEAVGAVLKVRTRPAWPEPDATSIAVRLFLDPVREVRGRERPVRRRLAPVQNRRPAHPR